MGENPELIAMARRIAEASRINGPLGLGPPDAYRAALAAIIETQERDAALVGEFATKRGFANADCLDLAAAILSGKHYGKDQP